MIKIIALFVLVFSFPPLSIAQEIDFRELEDYLKKEMSANQIPGLAIGVIKEGKIVFCKGFGESDKKASQVTADSPFLLASLTKSFTALAISQLESQGKVRYTDKVKDHLPFFTLKNTDYSDSMTIDHLLDHRSGIPGISSYKTNRKGLGLEEKARRLKDIKGTGRFGYFSYANDNYALLGLIIEKVSGQSYEEFVRHQILAPLSMSSTFFSQEEAAGHNVAKGHQLYFGMPMVSSISYHRANLANGGILSSAKDLCQYLKAHLVIDSTALPVLPALNNTNDLFRASSEDIYRKGWFINERNGKKFFSHRGQLSDYHNFFGFYPEEQLGLVVLINQNSLFLNNRIGHISENVLQFIETGSLPKATNAKLNLSYWIFIVLSVMSLILFMISLIREIRSNKIDQLSDEELRKTRNGIWIGNIIIPVAMLVWMWYLANYLMTSLHLAQPDILLMIQLLFIYSLLVGLTRLHRIRQKVFRQDSTSV